MTGIEANQASSFEMLKKGVSIHEVWYDNPGKREILSVASLQNRQGLLLFSASNCIYPGDRMEQVITLLDFIIFHY